MTWVVHPGIDPIHLLVAEVPILAVIASAPYVIRIEASFCGGQNVENRVMTPVETYASEGQRFESYSKVSLERR